ncbi:hypothetical protein MYX78_02245 [Acidobacteria bacterium AH-259-G07]|nr:hypothetical protein [Acidobacteria bacterium AH-259-G07]
MPKKQTEDFKPWEREEERKRKPSRGDSIPPKTSQTARLRSKPKIAGQEYLDLYLLMKQKERAEKYGDTLYKRQGGVSDEWKDMKKELYKMEKQLPEVPKGGTDDEEGETKSKRKKPKKLPRYMKGIDWDY